MIELPRKIVLFGVSKSGKSSLGDRFERRFGYHGTAFADPLKEAVQCIFGFSRNDLWGASELRETPYPDFVLNGWCFTCNVQCAALHPTDAEDLAAVHARPDYWRCPRCSDTFPRHATPRTALQTLGTAWGRAYCTELWAGACFRRMSHDRSYVVTDGRFLSERNAGRHDNACLVLLRRGLAESTSPHQSEKEIRDLAHDKPYLFDIVLDNTTLSADENFAKLLDQLELFRQATVVLERAADTPRIARTPIEWRQHEDRNGGLR